MYQIALSTTLARPNNLDRVVVLKGSGPLFFRIAGDSKPRLLVLTQHWIVTCLSGEWVSRIDRIVNRFWHLIIRRWRSFINKLVLQYFLRV